MVSTVTTVTTMTARLLCIDLRPIMKGKCFRHCFKDSHDKQSLNMSFSRIPLPTANILIFSYVLF
jgi:hypothetical protein